MDLKVSYNWLREYLPGLKATPEEVAEKLSLHAFSVERWQRMDEGLDPTIVVGRIEKIEPHPNADKLRLVYTEIGSPSQRRSNLPVLKIVCGGTNLYEGQLVAVALPGAKVRWHGEGELVELKPTEIRGVKSEGMICAANEIGLYELFPHKEREILDLTVTGAKVGESVGKALGLDDTIFEVEITTNRPDAMGMIGLAREVGAIFNVKCRMQNVKLAVKDSPSRSKRTVLPLLVHVEVPKLCPRYMAVVMEGIKVAPSPWWMQRKLIASGVRPINNIVDITNYVLLEYGQPCHAFDVEKLKMQNEKCKIEVRMAKKGEKILALDGNTYNLDENILVIADAVKPVAIAGIMGGEETGVHTDTSRIVFEIANFDALTVRRGEHQLALSSDSSARFNKGLPAQLPEFAAARLVELAQQIAGGKVVGVADRHNPSRPPLTLRGGDRVSVSPQEIVKKIGVEIPAVQMKKYLTALGFDVTEARLPSRRKPSFPVWQVTFPYWRQLEADGTADIAEEVARMYGYHKLPATLPSGGLPGELGNSQFIEEQKIKESLRGAGLTELYTYSLVSRQEIERSGFNPDRDALALKNPLSQDFTHLRPWLGISLLTAISKNEKARGKLNVFELSNEYHPRMSELPEERQKLIVVSTGREERDLPAQAGGEHFYRVKGITEHLAQFLSIPGFGYEKIGSTAAPWVKHYHPARVLLCKSGRDILGVVGELHPQLLRAYGLEHRVAFLEWETRVLYPVIGKGRVYEPPLPYPKVLRDIAFVVNKDKEYVAIHSAIAKCDPLVWSVELFDLYEGKGVPVGHRSLAFHISYASPDRTLTAQEADKVHEKISKMLKEKFKAEIR